MNPRKFFHSRNFLILADLLAVAAALWSAGAGTWPYPQGNGGLVAAMSGPWLASGVAAPCIGVFLTLLTAALLINLCSTFNLLRNITRLQASAFVVMMLSAPALMVNLCPPVVSALVVILCMYLMFSTYADPAAMPRVFLVFAILSACAGFDVVFIGLIPVFLSGCAQMRIFSLKAVLAMLMGIATPWIIMLCFGIVKPSDISLPDIPATDTAAGSDRLLPVILAASMVAFTAVAAWVRNLMKYLIYNAHSRAMLSMVTVLTFATVIFAAVNYTNLFASFPLLCVCASLQLGHLFGVVHTRPKSYIAIICFLLPFIIIAVWNVLLCI